MPSTLLGDLHDLKAAVDQAVGVSITDPQGRIIYSNALFAASSGYTPTEIIGRNHRVFNSGYHSKAFFADLWRTVGEGRVWRGEIRNRAKDGRDFWVSTVIVPFLDAEGRPYQYVSFRSDISDRKRAEEDLERERAGRQIAGRLAAIGEMASNIAHEIGNPLTAILMNAELLTRAVQGGSLSVARVEKAASSIARTAKRIDAIIRNLHALSRDGSRDPFERVRLAEVVRETSDFCRTRFAARGVRLEVGTLPEEIEIRARSVQISQLILNLLSNACDAVQGLPEKWVRLEFDSSDGATVTLRVVDSGHGNPEEVRARIMEPFFTTKGPRAGTGLGLSISKRIAEDHDGALLLDAGASHTTFELRLPVPPVARDTG